MSRPLAVDLCCGAGGWTDGLLAAGFDVIGVDVLARPEYRGQLILSDVRDVPRTLRLIREAAGDRQVRVVVRSPPCGRFSHARAGRVADPPTEADLAVFLVPARTNCRWFHRALELGAKVEFFLGKPKFVGAKHVSPVDCCLLVFRNLGESS